MGFFSKLFRRKPVSSGDTNAPTIASKGSRSRMGLRGRQKAAPVENAAKGDIDERYSPTNTSIDDPVLGNNDAKLNITTEVVTAGSSSPRNPNRRGPDLSDGSQRVVIKSRNAARNSGSSSPNTSTPTNSSGPDANTNNGTANLGMSMVDSYRGGPVDLDQSDMESMSPEFDENIAKIVQPRLSTQRLQEFTQQQQQMAESQAPIFTMAEDKPRSVSQVPATSRFSAGHVAVAVDDSDGESSSFNLSTDAEDTEYEDFKKRGAVRSFQNPPSTMNTSLDASTASQVSSPTNYNTDGEASVFPNLLTDDEGTINSALEADDPLARIQRLLMQGNTPENGTNATTTPSSVKDDPHAWPIHKDAPSSNTNAKASHSGFVSGFENNRFGIRRSFTSPKSKDSPSRSKSSGNIMANNNSSNAFKDDFANFADFAAFEGDFFAQPAEPSSPHRQVQVEGDLSPLNKHKSHSQRNLTSTSSAVTSDTSLSELLAQAKSKSASRNRRSSSSVNSAPAITPSFLRQQHGLKPRGDRSDSRSHTDGTSVTDIIKSLEADNASRSKKPSSNRSRTDSDARSTHSRDAASTRSAKERLRRRRENERRRSSRSPEDTTDSEEDNDAESWLMDEVTGALGPRGIAADLESLSGRSNRSRSSGGGLSHKSHRSHKSRSSRRRHKSSSGGSVNSHDSKRSHGSRRSRSSRYSHRSTRSYISQMSEQSRSVANDLLRLEMQLAMVNPNAEGSDNRSVSRSSRRPSSTRSSRSTPRRSRITVVAPPGKLGIILANKADSRGTVVSGVRTSSVLANSIAPGDRIVAIDGEDVSLMTVSEITTIMARKSDFERTLTVLTTPRADGTYR